MYFFSTHDNSQAISELNGDKGTFYFNEFMTLQYETLNRQHLNSFFCFAQMVQLRSIYI